MTPEENPFASVKDQEALSSEERERYFTFWASRTPNERLAEVYRLNTLKWGEEVFERDIDKTKLEVVNMATGEWTVIRTRKGNK